MAIDKLVYGKNVRDSVQANYSKTNEIIDKVNEGGSDTGLHAYTIYEGDTFGTSFTTTAPLTNFKFIELYYFYRLSDYISYTISSRQFVKIYNPTLSESYTQVNTPTLSASEDSSSIIALPTFIKYSIDLTNATTIDFNFVCSYTPRYRGSNTGKIDTTNTNISVNTTDNNFKVNLESVIGYV